MNAKEPRLDKAQTLREELKYWGEAFWRNEEAGEKRVTFFVTLVTAVLAGLVAVAKTNHQLICGQIWGFGIFIIVVLWAFGLLTMLRMVRRNLVAEEYKYACDNVRQIMCQLGYLPENYRPLPLTDKPKLVSGWLTYILPNKTGGLAETVIAINGILSGFLAFLLTMSFFSLMKTGDYDHWIALFIAIIVALLDNRWQVQYGRKKRSCYKKNLRCELKKT